jgi:hypothetical protein
VQHEGVKQLPIYLTMTTASQLIIWYLVKERNKNNCFNISRNFKTLLLGFNTEENTKTIFLSVQTETAIQSYLPHCRQKMQNIPLLGSWQELQNKPATLMHLETARACLLECMEESATKPPSE